MLTFACPHCGSVNQVPANQAGQVVACAACQKPFRSDVPAGTLVAGGASFQAQVAPAVASGGVEELLRLHPAAWRMRFSASVVEGVMVLGGLALVIFSATLRGEDFWFVFFLVGGGLLWLVGAFNLGCSWIKSRSETLLVTSTATRWSVGFFKRRSVEIRHDRLRAVEVEQSFFERLLGIGTLKLPSDGNSEDEIVMRGVPDPKAVADLIRRRMGK